jgi:hypothetical protein
LALHQKNKAPPHLGSKSQIKLFDGSFTKSVYNFQHNSLQLSGNGGSGNDGILSDRQYTIWNVPQKTPVTM